MSFFEKGEFKLLWRLYIGDIITNSFFIFPAFYLLYFMNIGFSLVQISFLFSAMGIATIIFEIPTGAIADKYGRKFSVLLGAFLSSILIISIYFVNNYTPLLIIFFLLGIVETFHSGAGESWVYDLIQKTNKKILHSYYSKKQLFGAGGLVISGFIGAFIVAKFGLSLIWIVSGLASLMFFIILFPLQEIYTKKKEHKEKIGEIWKHSFDSIKYTLNHKVLFWIFLAGFFMIIAVVFAENLAYIAYLKELGLPEYAFGYFFSGTSLVLALAPLTAKFFKGKRKETPFLIWATAIGSIILLFVYFAKSYFVAIPIILLSLLFFGMKFPIERPFSQKFIPTKKRATILSFQSMVYSLASVIFLPIGGFLIEKIGSLNVIIVSALLGIPTIIAYLMIKPKN